MIKSEIFELIQKEVIDKKLLSLINNQFLKDNWGESLVGLIRPDPMVPIRSKVPRSIIFGTLIGWKQNRSRSKDLCEAYRLALVLFQTRFC